MNERIRIFDTELYLSDIAGFQLGHLPGSLTVLVNGVGLVCPAIPPDLTEAQVCTQVREYLKCWQTWSEGPMKRDEGPQPVSSGIRAEELVRMWRQIAKILSPNYSHAGFTEVTNLTRLARALLELQVIEYLQVETSLTMANLTQLVSSLSLSEIEFILNGPTGRELPLAVMEACREQAQAETPEIAPGRELPEQPEDTSDDETAEDEGEDAFGRWGFLRKGPQLQGTADDLKDAFSNEEAHNQAIKAYIKKNGI